MKKNIHQEGNVHIAIIITVSIFIIGALGFVVWKNFIKPKTANTTYTKQANTQKQATSSIDQVADWNTYSSTKYGFKLRYPKSLIDITNKLNPSMPVIAIFDENKDFSSGNPELKISQYNSTLSAKDFAAANTTDKIHYKKDITINKLAAYEQTTIANGEQQKTTYFSDGKQVITFSSNSQNKSIGGRSDFKGDSTTDSIINTFKFTK